MICDLSSLKIYQNSPHLSVSNQNGAVKQYTFNNALDKICGAISENSGGDGMLETKILMDSAYILGGNQEVISSPGVVISSLSLKSWVQKELLKLV